MMLRSWSYRLRQPHTARPALARLHRSAAPLAVDNVTALIFSAPEGRLLSAAIDALPEPAGAPPIVREALLFSLTSRFSSCRRAAAVRLAADPEAAPFLREHLEEEPAWPVRAAIAASPHLGAEGWLFALSDPHWRARMPAIRHFLAAPSLPEPPAGCHPRVDGALAYLRVRRDPTAPIPPAPEEHPPEAPWWDPDPMVTRRELERLRGAAREASVPDLPDVLHLPDRRLRRRAVDDLVDLAPPAVLVRAVEALSDPRTPHVVECLGRISERLDVDRRAEVVDALCREASAGWGALCWALSQPEGAAHAAALLDHPHPRVRAAAVSAHPEPPPAAQADPSWRVRAAAAARAGDFADDLDARVRRVWAQRVADEPAWGARLAADGDATVRCCVAKRVPSLETDPDPRVRAAALTPERAARLWDNPGEETAWQVLARAASLVGRPLSEIAPPAVFIEPAPESAPIPAPGPAPASAPRRALGQTGVAVSPLGLSGHYGLDEAGFAEGVERGVNLLFWEPTYAQQTRFIKNLPPARRDELVILSGSYDADPKAVRRDIDAALRGLGLSRVGLFLIFWVRSPRRIDDTVFSVLQQAQERGDIGAFGMSTHQRPLAVQAIRDGWPVVMTRHNGAHRGAEKTVFPAAHAAGSGLITFSNLCYGRMLEEGADPRACYRYSLSFPGVQAVLSAPSTHEQLRRNLEVLDDQTLTDADRATVQSAGERLYRRNRAFSHGVRWR